MVGSLMQNKSHWFGNVTITNFLQVFTKNYIVA